MVRPGGHIANVGVHGKPVTLRLEELWITNITMTTGPGQRHDRSHADGSGGARKDRRARASAPTRSGLDQMVDAYDVFAHADTTTL